MNGTMLTKNFKNKKTGPAFAKVKAHSGIPLNEEADRQAEMAMIQNDN
jgi:ribonuclease HI